MPDRTPLRERLDAALRKVGLARNLAAYRDAVLPVVEAETAALRERAVEAEQELRAVEIDRDEWRNRAHAWRSAALEPPKETP